MLACCMCTERHCNSRSAHHLPAPPCALPHPPGPPRLAHAARPPPDQAHQWSHSHGKTRQSKHRSHPQEGTSGARVQCTIKAQSQPPHDQGTRLALPGLRLGRPAAQHAHQRLAHRPRHARGHAALPGSLPNATSVIMTRWHHASCSRTCNARECTKVWVASSFQKAAMKRSPSFRYKWRRAHKVQLVLKACTSFSALLELPQCSTAWA